MAFGAVLGKDRLNVPGKIDRCRSGRQNQNAKSKTKVPEMCVLGGKMMPHRVFVLDFPAHFRQTISAVRAVKKRSKDLSRWYKTCYLKV